MTVQEAIHSPSNDAETLRRANACLALYFQAEDDPDTKLAIRQAFVRALDGVPEWAMHAAFDAWERSGTRRPAPAEIVILAQRHMKPLVDELRIRHMRAAALPPPDPKRATPTRDEAKAILEAAGFTPARMAAVRAAPMARTIDEAEAKASEPRKPHWSETADPDGPEWQALRAERAANPLMNPKPRSESA